MTSWSKFVVSTGQKFLKYNGLWTKKVPKNVNVRSMSEHRIMEIVPTDWLWTKSADLFNFYILLGLLPFFGVIMAANTFVGPATLEPIPEGYIPKPHEYHRSPITRFMVKYLYPNPQQEYEKYLYVVVADHELSDIRHLTQRVKDMIRERQDYRFFNFKKDYMAEDIKNLRKRFYETKYKM